jgi:hypothetical protein
MHIPQWAKHLWRLGKPQSRTKHHPRTHKRERDLHGERRGALSKDQIIRAAVRHPRKAAGRGTDDRRDVGAV